MLICPEHLLRGVAPTDLRTSGFARHPIGSGRFRFASWTPGTSVEIVADTNNYRGRAALDQVNHQRRTGLCDRHRAWLFAGEADVYETVQPPSLPELARHPELRGVQYPQLSYGFLWYNLHDHARPTPHPLFGDRNLRRAFAMALDREKMVRNVFDSLGAVPWGPFGRSLSVADSTVVPLAYDTARANQLLDSLGWRRGTDGIRRRNGRLLAFTISVPTSSASRKRFAALIQDQLARVGARVTIDAMDHNAFGARLHARDFDAAINVWLMDPSPGSIRQTWATAAEQGGLNWGSYSSHPFDTALDSALGATDPARARRYFHQAFQIITDDAPGVWLYESKQVAGMNRRIRPATLRADAWWAHLADWWIPLSERIPRDKIGLRRGPNKQRPLEEIARRAPTPSRCVGVVQAPAAGAPKDFVPPAASPFQYREIRIATVGPRPRGPSHRSHPHPDRRGRCTAGRSRQWPAR